MDADVTDTGNSFFLLQDPMHAVKAYALWTHVLGSGVNS